MTVLQSESDDGGTPLTHDELEGLIPSYITLKRELNEAEQINIVNAEQWAFNRKRNVLDDKFIKLLHKHMFNDVWKWAGDYRTTERKIGVDAWKIRLEVHQLLDDTRYWIENQTYQVDEIAVRFHHKLVWIHPFPKGNGRHARIATDLLLKQLGCSRFTWGSGSLLTTGELRSKYIEALQAADRHNMDLLIAFVRS